jgi:cytochrome b
LLKTRDAAMVRIWDLPTRLFHWALAAFVVMAIISAHLGGAVMTWHMRSGYAIFTLLAFRLVWGFVGGRWSRFASFAYAPAASWRYLRGTGTPHARQEVGHTPLGAWSVFALLGVLAAQVATGLVADDEIASNGPLFKYVSSATSQPASHWHTGFGQWTIIGLCVLHVAAISFYWLKRRQNLVAAMIHGDKLLTADVPATIDTAASRATALLIAVVCAIGVTAIASLDA